MKKYFKRYLALVLTFALVLAVPFVFTQQADAAAKKSKTVKITQPVKSTYTYKNEKGKTVKAVTKYSYNKKGFVTKIYQKGKDGFKDVYKYNKKGYLKSYKGYNGKGKLEEKITVKMNKNGMPIESKRYTVSGKKSTLVKTVKIIYNGKNPVKYSVHDADTNETYTDTIEFGEYVDARQFYKEADESATNVKKDKKGRIKSETFVDSGTEEDGSSWSETSVYTYKYNKAGYRIKSTRKSTNVYKDVDGTTSTYKDTSTTTYKAFKMTKKLAKIDTLNWIVQGWI